MSVPSVDANYRFIAAYQEVNARIAQRQQALALYVTLTVSLLAALVALGSSAKAATAPVEWNYTSERALSNLRTFLASLEQLNDAHLRLPSYNTDPRWSSGANKARRFRDLATLLLALFGNVIGLGAAWRIFPQRLEEHSHFLLAGASLAALSIAVILITPRWSYAPATAA
jgi:hypothetical protein